MKQAGVREFRANTAALISGSEPVLVTRHGKVAGLYIPLEEPDRLPGGLGREIASILGHHISSQLDAKGISEEEILRDFDAYRRARR